jgi:hypothetical protein
VTITANPGLPDKAVYGGYLVFTPEEVGQTVRVPYSGFKGDYQSITVLEPTPNGFPWLAKLDGNTYRRQEAGATFTMKDGDIAHVLAHFEHFARVVKMEIVPLRQTNRNLDLTTFKTEYFGRNSTPNGFFAFAWDGTAVNTRARARDDVRVRVPEGDYQLKFSVLKALGDANNPAHWETWTSPVITVERP